jgi:hypothetical protein
MVRRVLEETRKACDKLELHPLNADEVTNLAQAIVISTFRRPAALVPWSTQELGRLEQLWQTAYKEVWHLMKGTCMDIFMFPSHAGGMQYPRPMAILWEATSRHIERAVRHDDVARQIIRKELESALDLWTCTSWQDLVDGEALRSSDCTAGACSFCVRHRGCLCCEVCERETDISGDWIDGTRLVDDSLSLNYHDMGSFLISEVRGVRLAGNPRSEASHYLLEFRGTIRG